MTLTHSLTQSAIIISVEKLTVGSKTPFSTILGQLVIYLWISLVILRLFWPKVAEMWIFGTTVNLDDFWTKLQKALKPMFNSFSLKLWSCGQFGQHLIKIVKTDYFRHQASLSVISGQNSRKLVLSDKFWFWLKMRSRSDTHSLTQPASHHHFSRKNDCWLENAIFHH